jgi:DNA repair protein RadC
MASDEIMPRGPTVPDTPAADRPRERLLAHGAAALRTAELLAILIRVGRPGESAPQAGAKLAAHFADRLDRLTEAGRGELKLIAASVGETAYCQIMAGIELGRRIAHAQQQRQGPAPRILSADDAIAFCREHFSRLANDAAQEEFHIVCLDAKHHVVGTHRVSVGSLDHSLVHPREVFRPAIKDAAKAILLVHNHPSGDPTPSPEDATLTSRLEEAAKTVGIQIVDHIIVARSGTVSLRQTAGKPA